MNGQTELLAKLHRIYKLETRLKSLKKEVENVAPALATELIAKHGEGTINTLGYQIALAVKQGRPSLAWRKYLDWLAPNLSTAQRAKEEEFTSEGETKNTIEVVKRIA